MCSFLWVTQQSEVSNEIKFGTHKPQYKDDVTLVIKRAYAKGNFVLS